MRQQKNTPAKIRARTRRATSFHVFMRDWLLSRESGRLRGSRTRIGVVNVDDFPLAILVLPHLRFVAGGVDGFAFESSFYVIQAGDERKAGNGGDPDIGKGQLQSGVFEDFGFEMVFVRVVD